ncbi:MAG: chaperone modulator CbpM [Gammaproteobacteria bacterium]|nr:chaperone modulator CbpM [Gammaproteobacteria bacterium]MDH3507403.1 chaperone modulator CbpM [Gammaproteobacteria bacterium]
MKETTLIGVLLDERTELSLTEICRACSASPEWIVELVEEGVLEPIGAEQTQWRFQGASVQRAHAATRLQRDLDINPAGVALALDLLDEIAILRARLRQKSVNDDV